MMNRKIACFGIGVLVCLSGTSMAAIEPPDNQPMRVGSPSRPADRSVMLIPSAWVVGVKVEGSDDKRIGEVNDLIVSRRSGRVHYALIGAGGVLGIGERNVPIPYMALRWNEADRHLEVPMTVDQMKQAPTLENKEWKALQERNRSEQFAGYYRIPMDRFEEVDRDYPWRKSSLDESLWPLMKVSELKGKTLMGDDGREIGTVDELVFDAASGRMAFVVVKFGGTLGFGSDRVALPWGMFDVNKDGHLFATSLDKEKVLAAPRLTEKNWGEFKDPRYGAKVYSHFGVRAGWIENTPASDPSRDKQKDEDRRDRKP